MKNPFSCALWSRRRPSTVSHGILWEVPQKVLIAVSKMVLFLMSVELFPALSLSQLLFIFLWTELLSITKW